MKSLKLTLLVTKLAEKERKALHIVYYVVQVIFFRTQYKVERKEYGWDEHFEALVSQIVADFINNYKPDKERCSIAEIEGEVVGSVFVVQHSETVY
jgi:hypothetical protein